MSAAEDRTVADIPKAVLVRKGLSTEELIALNDEIAGLARAGLPLDRGLAALSREMNRGRLKAATAEIAADLQQGKTLPEALERQGRRVPPYYAALVTAGVRSGRVAEVLATLTTYARSMAELRATVVGALFYPTVVFVLGLTIVTFVAYFLVPVFEKTFADFRMRLPWITEWAFVISRHPVLHLILPPALISLFLVVTRFMLGLTPAGRRLWARWLYSIPVVGTLIRAARLAAFTDMLAILVKHDVPLPEAVRLAGAASPDPLTEGTARAVEENLQRGLSLGDALRQQSSVPEVVAWMAGVGERHGNLPATLGQVAELYRRQAEVRASLLRTVLPPLFIVVTALLIVGLFFIAVFVPMLGLLEGLSGGRPGRPGGFLGWFF